MVANCWLRSGDTSSSNNCIHFLEETFEIIKGKVVGLFRTDSGFCSEKIFSFLENRNTPIPYVIAGRLHALLQQRIKDVKTWNAIDKGIWISEFTYQAKGWSKERRVVVIKQSVELCPKASGKKLKLFDDSLYHENDRFPCFFTNQKLPSVEIWEQYKRRADADAENRIQEPKADFGADGFCMDSFYVTEAVMRMVMMAYNLMSLYRMFSQQTRVHQRLSTLRFDCFAVGSWIVK